MATQNQFLRHGMIPLRTFLGLLFTARILASGQAPQPAKKPATSHPAATSRERLQVLNAKPLAMYYYSDDTRGLESLKAHAKQMTLVGPQCFWVDEDGVVHGEVPRQVVEAARRARLPIMPLVINPGFDRPKVSAMLHNPKARDRAVAYLAYLAKRDHFVGWQIDMEYIDPADKQLFTEFMRRVAARLHRDRRLVSIAVVPRFSDEYPDTRQAEFRTGEWGAPYDFRAIGRVVDFMVLMTYDHHNNASPPGPVAGYEWMKAALDYAVTRVPRSKLMLGIPFYAREWLVTGEGTLSRSMNLSDISPLLARPGVAIQWDERWRAPWFDYRQGTELHTVWFDNSRSFREKLGLARKYRLRGFAAWRLGSEDPSFWSVAAESYRKRQTPARRAAKPRAPAAARGRGSR